MRTRAMSLVNKRGRFPLLLYWQHYGADSFLLQAWCKGELESVETTDQTPGAARDIINARSQFKTCKMFQQTTFIDQNAK
jgi:hypothetical protein